MNPKSPLVPSEESILAQARALTPSDPPVPWRRGTLVFAGGVQVGGWTRGGHLVVVSTAEYSVTDPDRGHRLERGRDEATAFAALTPDGLAFRIPTTGEVLPVFGVYGGDASNMTQDGWKFERIFPW